MKQQFRRIRFQKRTLDMIEVANGIINETLADGFSVSLRQLWYRLIGDDALPDSWTDSKLGTPNTQRNYKRLIKIITRARYAGLIDWSAIIDRGRDVRQVPWWTDPDSAIASAAYQFGIDLWEEQKFHVEVWIEKDALADVVARAANKYRVPWFSSRGYSSATAQYQAARRFARSTQDGKKVVVIHNADHDPSGKHMSVDIADRLEELGGAAEVNRIALNIDQVREHKLPPAPAKPTDSRTRRYKEVYGDDAWELDAIPARTLCDLIEATITSFIDQDQWDKDVAREDEYKAEINLVSRNWKDATKAVGAETRKVIQAFKPPETPAVYDGWLHIGRVA